MKWIYWNNTISNNSIMHYMVLGDKFDCFLGRTVIRILCRNVACVAAGLKKQETITSRVKGPCMSSM